MAAAAERRVQEKDHGGGQGAPLPAAFFARPAEAVAPALLGAALVSTIGGELTTGRIVETEAYLGPHDPACHAAERIGRTRRNDAMYGPPGTAYVYLIYGIHWCLNVVVAAEGYPAAVLIRALEPLEGLGVMRARRGRPTDLADGPGKLAQALGIDGTVDGHPLDRPPLRLLAGAPVAAEDIVVGTRVGVTRAKDWPLRFSVLGSPWVSKAGGA